MIFILMFPERKLTIRFENCYWIYEHGYTIYSIIAGVRNEFGLKNIKGRDRPADISVAGSIIIKLVLEKYVGKF
jgi:hypothetical protein